MQVTWNFEYTVGDDGEVKKGSVRANEIHTACFEFHAIRQLIDKLPRDGYKILAVTSGHTCATNGTNHVDTPQTYRADDLPPRNPDASLFILPDAMRKRITPPEAEQAKKAKVS